MSQVEAGVWGADLFVSPPAGSGFTMNERTRRSSKLSDKCPTSKLLLTLGVRTFHLIHGYRNLPHHTCQTAFRSVQPFLQETSQLHDRQTYRPTGHGNVSSNRPHLYATHIRYGLKMWVVVTPSSVQTKQDRKMPENSCIYPVF